jgi:hypothetical protein
MSVWTTKSLGKERSYVILKHKLADINGNIAGVKFRGGYAVVEKDSKSYKALVSLPLLKGQPEYPLIHLRKLKFITRTADVKIIFGQDVYYHYIKELNLELEAEQKIREETKAEEHVEIYSLCSFVTPKGSMCGNASYPGSPSKHCKLHILKDPLLESVGINIPSRFTKQQKKEFTAKVLSKLDRV